jgi:hypothetical protein
VPGFVHYESVASVVEDEDNLFPGPRSLGVLQPTQSMKFEPLYCDKITTLYGPIPTLPLKFSPSLAPGLASVSKLSPFTKAGS